MQAKWENEFCVIMSLRETWARIKKENEKSQLESKVNFNRVGNSGRVTKIQNKKKLFSKFVFNYCHWHGNRTTFYNINNKPNYNIIFRIRAVFEKIIKCCTVWIFFVVGIMIITRMSGETNLIESYLMRAHTSWFRSRSKDFRYAEVSIISSTIST